VFVSLGPGVSAFGQATYELVKAFAFGADDWTRPTDNEPTVEYIKISQTANIAYSAQEVYGYADSGALDSTPNNRGIYIGNDKIYDQFIGADPAKGTPPLPIPEIVAPERGIGDCSDDHLGALHFEVSVPRAGQGGRKTKNPPHSA
jgi:hypothetical protein